MGFQIKNAEGKVITLNELDREACELWGKEYDDKEYANPGKEFVNINNLKGIELSIARFEHSLNEPNNWFDAIGWYISESKEIAYPEYMTWKNIIHAMIGNSLLKYTMNISTLEVYDKPKVLHINNVMQYYKPYIDLIKSWSDKGYTPHKVTF